MNIKNYRADVLHEFRKTKKLADDAMAQVSDDDFFRELNEVSNSIAIIVKHLAGNMRSRWRDFLTTDGEKPDRHRDTEFIIEAKDTRAALLERWEDGWGMLFDTVETLRENEFEATVYIRKEPHLVFQAINRQLTHYAYHVGQIVYLARYFAGSGWRTLSVPKGKSEEFRARPKKYLDEESS